MLVKIQKACGYDQHVMLIGRLVYHGDPTFGEFAHPLTIDAAMKMMPGHRWISRCSHALFAKQTTEQLSTAKRFLLKDSKAVAAERTIKGAAKAAKPSGF